MKTGALRPIVLARRVLGAGFSPLSLTPGAWYDGLDAATMFQDTAGTVPSTNGTPAARWNDKSGFANHLLQATPSSQPTRGVFGPTFDGADRYSPTVLTQGTLPQPYTFIVVCDCQLNLGMFFDNGAGVTRNLAQRGSTAATEVQINAGTSLLRTGVPTLATRRAWFFFFAGTNSTIKVGTAGSIVQQGASGNAGANTCADLRIGGNSGSFLLTGTGAREGMGELVFVPRALTGTEENNLLTYFTARHGLV